MKLDTKIYFSIAAVCGTVILAGQALEAGEDGGQADVTYADCTSINHYGPIGGIHAYSLGSNTCNRGDADLRWGTSNTGTPNLAMNAYRLENGRLVQIGLSNGKHSTSAAARDGCGTCNGNGGSWLGVGCLDVYGPGFNAGQSRLGNRSEINAWTGQLTGAPGGSGNDIYRRLQIAQTDLDPNLHPDAQFFAEGVYVAIDDAGVFGNGLNNASHKRVTVQSNYEMNPAGAMQEGEPAIIAWRDHGLGQGVPDPSVEIQTVDIPGEGRFYVLCKTTDLGDSWLYDYAIFNLNSDRAAGRFTVPAGSTSVSDVGFHDVEYHSGEVYDNTDWSDDVGASSVSWSSPETHTENPNSNAIRYGTMYNFWFTSDAPPADVEAEIGLFKPHAPSSVTVTVKGPMSLCPADLSGNGVVDFEDILVILTAWGEAGHEADLDQSGVVDFGDILVVLSNWGPCP